MNPEELFKDGNARLSFDKLIVFEEQRSKYEAVNSHRKKVCRIEIDGKLIKGSCIRCDFGLWIEDGNKMILIELKGSDVDKAFEQLEATMHYFQKHFIMQNFIYCYRIVPTRVTTPNLQFCKKRAKKRGIDIQVKEKILRERI